MCLATPACCFLNECRSARKYMIVFFLVASLALLFLDWWNS